MLGTVQTQPKSRLRGQAGARQAGGPQRGAEREEGRAPGRNEFLSRKVP